MSQTPILPMAEDAFTASPYVPRTAPRLIPGSAL